MKNKTFAAIVTLAACLVLPLSAKEDAPRGFTPISKLADAQGKAEGKKLIALFVHGSDDSCPHCATAMENGGKATGSGVVKVFARAETIKTLDGSAFPAVLKERIQKGFNTGASVTLVVFSPDMSKIIVDAGRDQLENEKQVKELKKTIQEAKMALK